MMSDEELSPCPTDTSSVDRSRSPLLRRSSRHDVVNGGQGSLLDGIISLTRLISPFGAGLTDSQAMEVAKVALGAFPHTHEDSEHEEDAVTPTPQATRARDAGIASNMIPSHAGMIAPLMNRMEDQNVNQRSTMRPFAFGPEDSKLAQDAVLTLRRAVKEVEMNGGKTVQILFRKPMEPRELAERVEFLYGPAPQIPVEMLVRARGGTWKQPPMSQLHATVGGDARKFVLKVNLPQPNGKRPMKLSLQIKMSTRELSAVGSKATLVDLSVALTMQFGAFDKVTAAPGVAAAKVDISAFFGQTSFGGS